MAEPWRSIVRLASLTLWASSTVPWEASETRQIELPGTVIAKSPVLLIQFIVVDPRSP
jgi:hypothetical protein